MNRGECGGWGRKNEGVRVGGGDERWKSESESVNGVCEGERWKMEDARVKVWVGDERWKRESERVNGGVWGVERWKKEE